jgi:hypothetical protein
MRGNAPHRHPDQQTRENFDWVQKQLEERRTEAIGLSGFPMQFETVTVGAGAVEPAVMSYSPPAPIEGSVGEFMVFILTQTGTTAPQIRFYARQGASVASPVTALFTITADSTTYRIPTTKADLAKGTVYDVRAVTHAIDGSITGMRISYIIKPRVTRR